MSRSRIYRGTLTHHRGGAVQNDFGYSLDTACFDLDELDDLDRDLHLLSIDRPNVYSLRGADYALVAGQTQASKRSATRPRLRGTLKERALALFSSAAVAAPIVRVELITQPRALGYVFNPVSFFIGYDQSDRVAAVIAEINNTYDQTFAYVLDDRCRRDDPSNSDAVFVTAKQFFVSPFIGDDCEYEWRFPCRRDPQTLDLRMRLARPVGGRFFAARLRGRSRPLTDVTLVRSLLRFPALPLQIWLRIHAQALRLRLLGLQYRTAPASSKSKTKTDPPAAVGHR